MNHTQYNKQIFQTMKNQHVQHLNRIKMLETELNKSAAQNNLENIQLKEMLNIEVEKKIQQLDFSNNRINELSAELDAKTAELDAKTAELDAKTAELEYSKKKINEILGDLDKKNDAFYNIDKIIFRNNEYFDEIKKELNDKIQHNKEVNELYEKKNHELNAIRMELELAYKELDTTKTELQLYKNDFILKSATF
jgi:chromosome segregation protein